MIPLWVIQNIYPIKSLSLLCCVTNDNLILGWANNRAGHKSKVPFNSLTEWQCFSPGYSDFFQNLRYDCLLRLHVSLLVWYTFYITDVKITSLTLSLMTWTSRRSTQDWESLCFVLFHTISSSSLGTWSHLLHTKTANLGFIICSLPFLFHLCCCFVILRIYKCK